MAEIDGFFKHYIICKLFHFQTTSGFRHTKIDAYTALFLANFDSFMEVFQGQFGTIDTTKVHVSVIPYNDDNILEHFNDMISFLKQLRVNGNSLSDELATIRDQMIADIQQQKYLFTFQ